MKTIEIATQIPYKVLVGSNIVQDAGHYLKSIQSYHKIAIITDDTVNDLHGDVLRKSLEKESLPYCIFSFSPGEASKNIHTLSDIYTFLIQNGLSRSDLIIAFGGGVVGDVAGLAAATYLRGIDYIQIPTTLIAQTDSSVGGKTAIDMPLGKNLVGAFYQPKMVICDTDLLKTLPENTFNAAMAEVVKYAIIDGNPLFSLLEDTSIWDCLEEVIERCINIKANIVAEDEFDTGRRMLLNLGHTFGHAVENHSCYKISHGEGVSIGMAMMTKTCVLHGWLSDTEYQRIIHLLHQFNLPDHYDNASLQELCHIASHDKKRLGESLSLVICRGIGHCEGKNVPLAQLYEFMTMENK